MSAINPYRRAASAANRPDAERGAIAIMFFGALIALFGMFALALDLAQLYNRKMELQNLADTVALGAASALDGTEQGLVNAAQKASEPFTTAIWPLKYQYGNGAVRWNAAALAFADNPAGPWLPAAAAQGHAAELLFAKVDTANLDADYGKVHTIFISVLRHANVTSTSAHAIAGRAAVRVTPLGICAMRPEAQRNRNGELEEFGYRRGVGYNLLDLNPDATQKKGLSYAVTPFASAAAVSDPAVLAPFVCTGTMAMARLKNGKVRVASPFPLADLFNQFNSRFGTYAGATNVCNARTAPPDNNIKEYTFNGGALWMKVQPAQQSALLSEQDGKRWTVAGPDPTPTGTTGPQFGPLWSYAKAVRFDSVTAGVPEPAAGYTPYTVDKWSTLYNPGQPSTSSTTLYPSTVAAPTPYLSTAAAFYKASTATNRTANRRVLNLPLLACPAVDNKAQVLGIGKFFMPVSATSTALYGEFAGLVPEESLGAQVLLYP